MKIVYIEPKSTFPFLSSDSLFGAIISAISELYPNDVDGILDRFNDKDSIPFVLSSMFPYYKAENGKIIRFFPSPMGKTERDCDNSTDNTDLFKKIKKIKFLEEDIFIDLIGGGDSLSQIDIFQDNFYIGGNNPNFLLTKSHENLLNEPMFFKEIAQHNVIDRIMDNSINIYYSEKYRFNSNAGLYFLISIYDERFESIINSSLKFLKDRGFGGDISTGNGHFDYEIEDYSNLDDYKSENDQYFVTLSRFIPDDGDLENICSFINDKNDCMWYEIGNKRSRDQFGLRKQTRFFKEGSVFPIFGKNYGSIIKTSDKSVENGYAFTVSYKLEE